MKKITTKVTAVILAIVLLGIQVESNIMVAEAANKAVKVGNRKYTITSKKKKTVRFDDVSKRSVTTLSIPATVKIGKKTYKVTAIKANALKNSKISKLVIGKNVKTIGKKAFYGSKLKSITIKSKKITSIGKKALGKLNSKIVVTLPSMSETKINAYKKMIKKSGLTGKNQVIKTSKSVCFIGNSLIQYGNQAGFLEDIARSYENPISVGQITWGGAHLSDYLEGTYLTKEYVKKKLKLADIVVFQDYGGWGGKYTIDPIRKLEKWCKKGARLYYYMYDGDDEEMEPSDYEKLKKLGLQFIPKGQLIYALEDQPYTYDEMHLENDFHPNAFNGYLAALVMNSVIFDKKCIDFPKEGLFGGETRQLSASTKQVIKTLRGNTEEEKWSEFQRICKIADEIISESKNL